MRARAPLYWAPKFTSPAEGVSVIAAMGLGYEGLTKLVFPYTNDAMPFSGMFCMIHQSLQSQNAEFVTAVKKQLCPFFWFTGWNTPRAGIHDQLNVAGAADRCVSHRKETCSTSVRIRNLISQGRVIFHTIFITVRGLHSDQISIVPILVND